MTTELLEMNENQKEAIKPVKGFLREACIGEEPGIYAYDGEKFVRLEASAYKDIDVS